MENFEIFGVPSLKKGSGIHIKKKNRGKFTDYCGGKVTQECIDKAKKSKNPKLRKRATFAANSRRWSKKHEEGAKIHKPNGHRSVLDNGWIPTKELKKKHKLVGYNQEGGSVYPNWLIPDNKEFVEKVMKWNSIGDFRNLIVGMKDINYGSRIVGSYTPGYLKFVERPTPDKSRDLISQYLYKKSSLVPYKNPTTLIVNGEELTGDQFEGKIFLGNTMILPTHMQEIVNDYVNNRKILSMKTNEPEENSWYEYNHKGQIYDNTRAHYISLKKDTDGNLYADIFDRWDMDHNRIGRTLEKKHGNPFILRQRVPIKFSDTYDYDTMSYLQNLYDPNLLDAIKTNNWQIPASTKFKQELNKNFNIKKLSKIEQDKADQYGYELRETLD